MKEYIICSAIHFNDGKSYVHQPDNIEQGFVISGRRHHNCFATLSAIEKSINLNERIRLMIDKIDRETQGFITNTNRFVDRKEAMSIAFNAGQILDHAKTHRTDLFSEDIF